MNSRASLCIQCTLTTLAIHALALVTLYQWPLILSPTPLALLLRTHYAQFGQTSDQLEEEQLLQQSLEEIAVIPPSMQPLLDIATNPLELQGHPEVEPSASVEHTIPIPSLAPMQFPSNTKAAETPLALSSPIALPPLAATTPPLPPSQENGLLDLDLSKQQCHIPEPLLQSSISESEPIDHPSTYAAQMEPPLVAERLIPTPSLAPTTTPPFITTTPSPQIPPPKIEPLLEAVKPSGPPLPHSPHSLPPTDIYLPKHIAEAISDNNYFDISVKMTKSPEGKGFFFSLQLLPRTDAAALRMPQHFTFLIDRSSSIGRHRYAGFKRAVQRSLLTLPAEDSFNICIFDRKIAWLSTQPLAVSSSSIRRAEEFLNAHEYQGAFAAGDLYSFLPQIIPPPTKEEVVHTAILLSDGHTLLKPSKQRATIKHWLEKNQGKVALYAAAAGSDNNLTLLDLLATSAKGTLMHSDIHTAFPRKFAQLVHNLSHPIAQEVHLTAIAAVAGTEISLYPLPAPNLYASKPYTILGTLDTPSDFTFILQGKTKNQTLTIRKTIEFCENGQNLEKEWSTKQAYVSYLELLK